jgi:hypothetical protein
MRNLIPVHVLMLKQRDNVRDFPGRRWLSLSLRTVHLSGIVLLGAGQAATAAWLTLISSARHVRRRRLGQSGASARSRRLRRRCQARAGRHHGGSSALGAAGILGDPRAFQRSHAPGALRHRRLSDAHAPACAAADD